MKHKLLVIASLMVLCAAPAHAQSTASVPFRIVEATIDEIHTAFRSGRLTARQLVQGYLDRINAYDKQGPNINSVISVNPNALSEADRLSSGGSGAALTASFSTVTIGEETVASIRRPAAWNAVVSLRPTPGLVSRTGMWDGYPTVHAQM